MMVRMAMYLQPKLNCPQASSLILHEIEGEKRIVKKNNPDEVKCACESSPDTITNSSHQERKKERKKKKTGQKLPLIILFASKKTLKPSHNEPNVLTSHTDMQFNRHA
jgi:hypothetical protein